MAKKATDHLVFEVIKKLEVGDLVHITINPDGSIESPELVEHKENVPEN